MLSMLIFKSIRNGTAETTSRGGLMENLVTIVVPMECATSAMIACEHAIVKYRQFPQLKGAVRNLKQYIRLSKSAMRDAKKKPKLEVCDG